MSKVANAFFLAFQHLAPKQLITRAAGYLADRPMGEFTTFVINRFINRYSVDMDLAAEPSPSSYETFNRFFTRPLREGVRPVDPRDDAVVFPVDGAVSQAGRIQNGRIIQAKGFDYSLNTLLGGDRSVSAPFQDGSFITVYLSPKDYHRVHMPFDGRLMKTVFVPGRLYSVNPLTVSSIDGIFARNERVVCIFDTAFGPMALVMVGATVVGSMETVWAGQIRGKTIAVTDHAPENRCFRKGEEIGRFRLGSTVICCFPKDVIRFEESVKELAVTQMGGIMARLISGSSESKQA